MGCSRRKKSKEPPLCPKCGNPLRHGWAYTNGDWWECVNDGMVVWVCLGCGHRNEGLPRLCGRCHRLFWMDNEPPPPAEMKRLRERADKNWPDL